MQEGQKAVRTIVDIDRKALLSTTRISWHKYCWCRYGQLILPWSGAMLALPQYRTAPNLEVMAAFVLNF
jgi:hypothetical protein